MPKLLTPGQEANLLQAYLQFVNADRYPEFLQLHTDYALDKIERFNDSLNFTYLVEFLSDMEEYSGYMPQTIIDNETEEVLAFYPMFSNVGTFLANPTPAENIFGHIFGWDGMSAVIEYRQRFNISCTSKIGTAGLSYVIRKCLSHRYHH